MESEPSHSAFPAKIEKTLKMLFMTKCILIVCLTRHFYVFCSKIPQNAKVGRGEGFASTEIKDTLENNHSSKVAGIDKVDDKKALSINEALLLLKNANDQHKRKLHRLHKDIKELKTFMLDVTPRMSDFLLKIWSLITIKQNRFPRSGESAAERILRLNN